MNLTADKKHIDDLLKDIDYRLVDLLSHTKILTNSTSEQAEFEIDYVDVNSFALTLYNKISKTIEIFEDLKQNFDNL